MTGFLLALLLILTVFLTSQPSHADSNNQEQSANTEQKTDLSQDNSQQQQTENNQDNNSSNSQPAKPDQDKPKKPKNVVTFKPVVKIAGRKNYAVYQKIVKNKPVKRIAKTVAAYRKNHLESTQYVKTRHGRYWLLYVDGRKIGYVHEHYFVRNAISMAKTVNLVRNPYYKFPVKFAVNYVTNKYGSVVTPKLSKQYISTKKAGTYKIKVGYADHFKTLKVIVRKNAAEGVVNAMQKAEGQGTSSLSTIKHHVGNSGHYQDWTHYASETDKHLLSDNDLTLKTVFYQPVYLSLHARQADNNKWDNSATTVGHVLEGTTVDKSWLYTSYLAHVNNMQGYVVGYNLGKLTNAFQAQHLNEMSLRKFNKYLKNMQVSPLVPTGHGQAMGSTKKYVYLMVNNHKLHGSPASELLVQLRHRDLAVNQIWSFKVWNQSAADPRYAQNGYMINDKTLMLLANNGVNDRYEWWKLHKHGNSWLPELAAVTKGRFVNNGAPVQGVAYDKRHDKYYIAFNDLICQVDGQGNFERAYKFNTGREIEGISIANNCLYANLSQRPELVVSQEL